MPTGKIIKECTVRGVTALTFDDGPWIYTSHILDVLDEYNINATFFINGNNWSTNIDDESGPWPALLRRMVNSGHQIGSHGWSHVDMSKVDSQTRYQELHDLEVAIFNVLGKYPTYFRPPFGSCDSECIQQAEEMGYHVVGWDLDTKDWRFNTPDMIGQALRLFNISTYGSSTWASYIVLTHEVQELTVKELLPPMLNMIHVRGKNRLNLTVADCMHDPPENWYRVPSSDWDPNPSPKYYAARAWASDNAQGGDAEGGDD